MLFSAAQQSHINRIIEYCYKYNAALELDFRGDWELTLYTHNSGVKSFAASDIGTVIAATSSWIWDNRSD